VKKLQVKINGQWAYVFANVGGQVKTTTEKAKGLPQKAMWGADDLAWAQSKWANNEFRLADTLAEFQPMTAKQKRDLLAALLAQPAEWVRRSLANPTPYMGPLNLALHKVALRRMGAL
jgi:hypothetical protein